MKKALATIAAGVAWSISPAYAFQQGPPGEARVAAAPALRAETLAGLELRGIGPALMAGRIADVAIDPTDRSTWYVATGSGGVWKTENAGTTWEPIFDRYGSYSIGTITLDPKDPRVVWLGTGEKNGQRSVGYGDGVYRSVDGGKSWRHVGLEKSEHIARIVVDPRDPEVVYVAAQGPLWAAGGDRGLYKTTDGGRSWKRVLHISENTGITEVVLDPRDPDVVYAAAYQRRRHVGIQIAGGPEGGIYKSSDGGRSWKKLTDGLPGGDLGRIGLAVSPIRPDVVYALVAASGKNSGFFRSADRGESWVKQSDYIVVDPQYYMELFPDPHRFDRVYAVDVRVHVTEDGGKSFGELETDFVHVDFHEVVFDPADPDYLMVGNDGGLYESWDRGKSWKFIDNLPIAQFYRVEVDDAAPFYNVYGGAQDNGTLMGPSRTPTVHGILNRDWISIGGGDGMQPRVDPADPDVVYAQAQYGALVRNDLRTGKAVPIKPREKEGEDSLRWYWSAPLVVSPHAPKRLYFAANRLFRSDDRGDSWVPVSPELTREIDRDTLLVMGRRWSPDAVWKHKFTSPLGTITALDESPLVEGLLYVGTDDGLIQVSEDGGRSWRASERFPGVPALTYVADVLASRHDASTVYAVFNNYQQGDFRPYILRSTDRGRSWRSVAGDLPDRHVAWTIVEDHEAAELLFAGTEFGLFVTLDGGRRWVQLRGGLPTIAVRDLAIQRRESDLVAGTFGRGVFILEDYSPLRQLTASLLAQEAVLFPIEEARLHAQRRVIGGGARGTQGHGVFAAPNPPYGASFTYYLKDGLERSGKASADSGQAPAIVVVVSDAQGKVIREIEGPATPGIHRMAWDLRHAPRDSAGGRPGPEVEPGRYTARAAKRVGGVRTLLGEPRSFEVAPLYPEKPQATEGVS